MPIRERTIVDLREEMVLMWLSEKYSAQEVADRYETSRPTLYKWTAQYRQKGRGGLEDRSRAPKSCPHKTSCEIEEAIVEVRKRFGWGPKKLVAILREEFPHIVWPQPSTLSEILKRRGMVESRPKRRKTSTPFRRKYEPSESGDLMTADFKGQFKTGDGVYCYPLTMMDYSSRFLLDIRGFDQISYRGVWSAFRRIFREYGMPRAAQSDNGVPFADVRALARLSRLSVKLMKHGIQPVLNEPGHPEQNGAHERMHATLKAATTRPPGATLRDQQKKFDSFRARYNHERPHESLGQKKPASLFHGSPRPFPAREPKLDYPTHCEVRFVSVGGTIKWKGRVLFLASALIGEHVALEEIDTGLWSIQLGSFEIARFDERSWEIL